MKIFVLVLHLSTVFPQHSFEKDIAFRMVRDHLQESNIPEAFIREAFTHDEITIHPEIAERFAKPFEKKTWGEYRKIFVKENRIASDSIKPHIRGVFCLWDDV